MYLLKEVKSEGETPVLEGVEIRCNESLAAIFRGGLSLMIATTAAACRDQGELQCFLHGLVLAMLHCAMTGSIPTVVDR